MPIWLLALLSLLLIYTFIWYKHTDSSVSEMICFGYAVLYCIGMVACAANGWLPQMNESSEKLYDEWEEGYDIGYDSGYDSFLLETFWFGSATTNIKSNWQTDSFSMQLNRNNDQVTIEIENYKNIEVYRVYWVDDDFADFDVWDDSLYTFNRDYYNEKEIETNANSFVYKKDLPEDKDELCFLILCDDNKYYTAKYELQ